MLVGDVLEPRTVLKADEKTALGSALAWDVAIPARAKAAAAAAATAIADKASDDPGLDTFKLVLREDGDWNRLDPNVEPATAAATLEVSDEPSHIRGGVDVLAENNEELNGAGNWDKFPKPRLEPGLSRSMFNAFSDNGL